MATTQPKWPTRMNATDALFWFMDRIPEMRSTVGGLIILERPPATERVRDEYERLSQHLVRLRQRVVEVPFNLAPPEWIEDSQFDLGYHVRRIAIPQPGGMAELLEELGPVFATPFDPDRPLWEAYVIDGLMDGRGAVFFKMHHCLADGVGSTQMFEQLLGSPNTEPPPRAHQSPSRSTSPGALLWRAALYNLEESVQIGRSAAGWLGSYRPSLSGLASDVRGSWRTVRGFTHELTVPRAESPLHQHRSLSRHLSTFDMSLTAIDAVREKLAATNNDLVLTIVSGAMHRWHTSRGSDVRELRALVPVNLRHEDDPEAGNRIALLAVDLPVGEPNPLRRLRAIQARMGHIKSDRRAALYPFMARVLLSMPSPIAEGLSRQQTTRTNFVCTNVPGPRRTCYLAGEAIESVYAYAPLVGDHPVAIALYTYRDAIHVGLDIDPLAMGDVDHFRDAMRESYEEVLNIGASGDIAPRLRRAPGRARSKRRVQKAS